MQNTSVDHDIQEKFMSFLTSISKAQPLYYPEQEILNYVALA